MLDLGLFVLTPEPLRWTKHKANTSDTTTASTIKDGDSAKGSHAALMWQPSLWLAIDDNMSAGR